MVKDYCMANGVKKVAVLVCGPEKMVSEVKKNNRIFNCSKGSPNFHLHYESFDFLNKIIWLNFKIYY